MTSTQKTANIFSCFHDGTLTAWEGDLKKLSLTISVEYVAECLGHGFENFYVELFDIETLKCEPWDGEPVDYKTLFCREIEINTADEKDGQAVITYFDNNFPTMGGFIYINAGSLKLYRHDQKEITVEELIAASNKYWSKFGR